MGFDIKYRPLNYSDVLGQENTIKILKQYVRSNKGYQQSYIFSGTYGTGKTTVGRIFARALLCDFVKDGEPCNKCETCKSIIEGNSDCFFEIDAATNSGKEDIKEILEKIQYLSFSGKKKIFLFDECHQLSKNALDALLKPMEDNEHGSLNKKLVCIFCTTEIEKMRATIISRCAPIFYIQQVTTSEIVNRLKNVCEKENIKYDAESLEIICEHTNLHIRDALKTLESIAVYGDVTLENVKKCLNIDLNNCFLDLILADTGEKLKIAKELLKRVSPGYCYEKLSQALFLCFSLKNGFEPDNYKYFSKNKVKAILNKYSDVELLNLSKVFSEKPYKCNEVHFLIEVSNLSQKKEITQTRYNNIDDADKVIERGKERINNIVIDDTSLVKPVDVNDKGLTLNNVYVAKEAINPNMRKGKMEKTQQRKFKLETKSDQKDDKFYSKLLKERFEELCREKQNMIKQT